MSQRNEIRGTDIMGNVVWTARQIANGQREWEGTGIGIAGFMIFTDIRSCIQIFLTSNPETDTIQGVLDGSYRIAVPSNAAAITILDAILKELHL